MHRKTVSMFMLCLISLGGLSTCNKRRWDILLHNVNGGIVSVMWRAIGGGGGGRAPGPR